MGILDEIVARRLLAVAELKRITGPMPVRSASAPRPLFGESSGAVLIAECKKASPSKGLLVADYDPVGLARAYVAGGASAISVLTEPDFFLGRNEDLVAVRAAVPVPVLRKDFIVDRAQIDESHALGADLILLIAAALDRKTIDAFAAHAHGLGLQVLLEVRDAEELEAVADAAVDAIGVNARNLSDFSVDLERVRALAQRMPPGCPAVAESGLRTPEEAVALQAAGFSGFLIGETFTRARDPEAAVRSFRTALDAAGG